MIESENHKARNSNIELLRLVLMLMVILLHFNNRTMGGAFEFSANLPLNNFYLHFLESLSICAVNCFLIISGYFLYTNTKIKTGKILDIILIVIFYRYINYFIQILFFNESFSFKHLIYLLLPMNYFAIFYIVSYIFSPFIAKIWNNIDDKKSNILIAIIFLIFILVPTFLDIADNLNINISDSLSPISTQGNERGYSIVQFISMLSLGMWLRKKSLNPSMYILIIFYLLTSLIMTFLVKHLSSIYNYCSILTVINAVLLFLIFHKLKIENRFINFCSKSCFAIFCIHTSGFSNSLWRKYFITYEHFSNGLALTILWTFVSVFSMFMFCLIFSFFFRLLFDKLKNKIISKMPELRFE